MLVRKIPLKNCGMEIHVKQNCGMEVYEEKLYKLVIQSIINDTKDVLKCKANEIIKNRIENNRSDMGGFMSRIDGRFNDLSISNNECFAREHGSGFGPSSDMDSLRFPTKSKNCPTAPTYAPPKGCGMQLGGTKRTSQFMASLKVEGGKKLLKMWSKSAAPPPNDPETLLIEEKLNVTQTR